MTNTAEVTVERFVVDGVELPLVGETDKKWKNQVEDVLVFMDALEEMDVHNFIVSTSSVSLSDSKKPS